MPSLKYFPSGVVRQPAGLPGLLVFFITFGVYLSTAAPCVTFWDSGELVLGAFSLGLPHPPAYPVFCLVGKIFSLLPFGNVAYRLTLLSCFFASATVYLLYRLLSRMGKGIAGFDFFAASSALLFAFYQSFWSVAVITEVYTLNSFLLASAVYCLAVYEDVKDGRYIYLSVFLLGVALANHQSVVFSLPFFFAYYLLGEENYKNPAALSVMSVLFLVAYSVYMYLPLRASAGPLLNIGEATDIYDFGWVIKWPEYFRMLKPLSVKALGLLKGENLPALAAVLVGAAFIYVFRRRRYILLVGFASLANFAGIGLLTAGAEEVKKWGLQNKFYVPGIMFTMIFASALVVALAGRKPLKDKTGAFFLSLATVLFLLASMECWNNYKTNDNSRNFFAYDFSHNTLKSATQDGTVFALGDNGIFPVWYIQGVERYREDVLFIHTELLTYPWYMNRERRLVYDKYGFDFIPPAQVGELKKNVEALMLLLDKKTPYYFDYSAAASLNMSFDQLGPQGLLHISPSWRGKGIGQVWSTYVMRGAFDDSTSKAFAAEGILDIYAWESALWAQLAYAEGRPAEAIKAYEISKKLGLEIPKLDQWILKVKKEAGTP